MKPSRTISLLIPSLLATLSLPGCYGDVEAFAKKTAKFGCQRMAECQKANFEDRYGGDLERCRDDTYTDILDFHDLAQQGNCEYVPDEGKVCGSTMKSLRNDCGEDADQDINDACEEVYDCPGLLVPEEDSNPGPIVMEVLASFPEDDPDQP